jgi:hypothetical protein
LANRLASPFYLAPFLYRSSPFGIPLFIWPPFIWSLKTNLFYFYLSSIATATDATAAAAAAAPLALDPR